MDDFNDGLRAPETKIAEPTIAEARAHETKVMETFAAFKAANDERLAEIDRLRHADVLLEEKVERLDRELDRVVTHAQRPALAAPNERSALVASEHKAAFDAYVRSGRAEPLRMLEVKATNGTLSPDTGYLLPPDAERAILARMAAFSPIRSIATVRPLANASLKKAVYPVSANSGWAAQTAPSNTVTSNQYSELNFPTLELYAQPAATQAMLDDSAVDIESWIAEEIVYAFSEAESAAFVNGDGVNRPKGFLNYPTVAEASWTWGNIGNIGTGVSANFPASNPSDVLIDFSHTLKTTYRQNATFVMNRKTQGVIRKFKDSTGSYLWSPPTMIGAKATFMNFPVVEAEDMPDIAANSLSIAFGDFRRGYLVIDRIGIRSLRDPFSAKPYVLFYTTKRVGGGVQDFDAIKALRFGV